MEFLGFTRGRTRFRSTMLKKPVIADYAGLEMPADMLRTGIMAHITMQLVRFDPAVLNRVQAQIAGAVTGQIQAGEIGTLLLAENSTFRVMVRSPYVSKPIFSSQRAGVRLLWAFLDESFEAELTTEEQVWNLTFTGLTNISPLTLAGTCWDSDMSGFPPTG